MTQDAATAPARLADRAVCVLMGGRSSEREVSLASGRAVAAAIELGLRRARERGEDAPRSVLSVEIDPEGRWHLGEQALEPAQALLELPADALFFLALHGGEGEGGVVQGLLEGTGRAYTGSGVAASALCLDKHRTRLVLADAGVRVAPGHLVRPEAWRRDPRAEAAHLGALGGTAWFVKPNRGGSSLGVTRVETRAALSAAVEAVLGEGDAALVEARVEGVEATCGVLGNRGEPLRALPPVEIRPRGTDYFDYREKYDASGALELCPPENLADDAVQRLQALARRAHEVAGCDGVSRTDFIVPSDGTDPVALEINTLPGMTARSLVPRSAGVAGLDFPALCFELLRLGLGARRERPA